MDLSCFQCALWGCFEKKEKKFCLWKSVVGSNGTRVPTNGDDKEISAPSYFDVNMILWLHILINYFMFFSFKLFLIYFLNKSVLLQLLSFKNVGSCRILWWWVNSSGWGSFSLDVEGCWWSHLDRSVGCCVWTFASHIEDFQSILQWRVSGVHDG